MPWSMELRKRCTSGSFRRSMTVLSSSVSAPWVVRSICLPSSAERSRTRRRNLEKVEPMGSMRTESVESRSSSVSRSNSSDKVMKSWSSFSPATWVIGAWTMTNSPTRSTR